MDIKLSPSKNKIARQDLPQTTKQWILFYLLSQRSLHSVEIIFYIIDENDQGNGSEASGQIFLL